MIKTTIVAVLRDPEYGEKHRKRKYANTSEWEWGMGADGSLYCRDDSPNSIFTGEWFLVEQLQLTIDLATIHRISRWSTSLTLKGKVKSLMDKEAMS